MEDYQERTKRWDDFLAAFKEKFVVEHMPYGRAGERWYTMKPVMWEKVRDFLAQTYPIILPNDTNVGCPPHNFVDYVYPQPWAASVPPPNKRCTKCLMETRF